MSRQKKDDSGRKGMIRRRQDSSSSFELLEGDPRDKGPVPDQEEEDEMDLQPVALHSAQDEEDLEEVDVIDHHDQYAAVHDQQHTHTDQGDHQESSSVPVFYDGKGQMRGAQDSNALSITLGANDGNDSSASANRKRRTNFVTPRDRAARSDSHKIHVLALLAHAKIRNRWLNDEALRDHLYNVTPVGLRQKLRAIHPKKEPQQRERVRLFEAFMGELVRWWAVKFYLDPDMSAAGAIRQPDADVAAGKFPQRGRRVDGWVVESEKDREQREAAKRQDAERSRTKQRPAPTNGKRKRDAGKDKPSERPRTYRLLQIPRNPRDSIALTPPGPPTEVTMPTLFHLIQPPPEPIRSPVDLISAAESKAGSRETSAQLFCALCRSLGIPARLVISPQVAPWSISAAKVAQAGATGNSGKKKVAQPRFARRGSEEATSDDYDYEESQDDTAGFTISGSKRMPAKPRPARKAKVSSSGTASRPASVASTVISDDAAPETPSPRRSNRTPPQVIDVDGPAHSSTGKGHKLASATAGRAAKDAQSGTPLKGKGKGKGKGKAKGDEGDDGDYRDAKWKGLTTPLDVEYKPKLRTFQSTKVKEGELGPRDLADVDPIDLTAPPTMWVEVFSKPFQKWLTVDPIRARVSPTGNRNMEPLPYDRTNKLVYVVAFEEDGYARDVTARYTKTLHSRVSKLRPPATLNRKHEEQDWWTSVVASLHRPERLERDAAEDLELEEAASKEPMPNSVGGFKDHPVFILERFLKRDEAFQPQIQVGTFQGIPVFHRRNVVTLRSARQWYNEGRVVKPDAGEPLKWVKSRGYTLANKRAEEQARQEGNEDSLKEGLYCREQTIVYEPPPVYYDEAAQRYVIPKNHFGNIDLFVPSMLPRGAVHVPQSGTAKIAKKLNVDYAEAIVGFEFRKHRSMPTIRGIAVPAEHEGLILDAYWESEHLAAEKEMNKQQERAMKLWRKFIAGLSIAKRVREQYGGAEAESGGMIAQRQGIAEGDEDVQREAGGFLVDDENGEDGDTSGPHSPRDHDDLPTPRSKMAAKLDKYGSNAGRSNSKTQNTEEGAESDIPEDREDLLFSRDHIDVRPDESSALPDASDTDAVDEQDLKESTAPKRRRVVIRSKQKEFSGESKGEATQVRKPARRPSSRNQVDAKESSATTPSRRSTRSSTRNVARQSLREPSFDEAD